MQDLTIAILAKDKAHCLPLYLQCLENQTFPSSRIHLWIRTNNNNDDTAAILTEWVKENGSKYKAVTLDCSDVADNVQQYQPHEWNVIRFKVLGAIRQASVNYALQHNTNYLVIDCDNFLTSRSCIEDLLSLNLPVVGPLLRAAGTAYANYHLAVDANGYYADHPHYFTLLERQVKGVVEVPVIHCTYLIMNNALQHVCYDDNSKRYEYVVFSDWLRRKGVQQYLDNRKEYGYLTFADTLQQLQAEPWFA